VTDKISAYSAAEPIAPPKGSNSNGIAADKAQGESSQPGASAPQSGDTVTLTASARTLQKIEEALARAPVVDAAKVAAVKQSIQSGSYQINAGRIAGKMLNFERGLK